MDSSTILTQVQNYQRKLQKYALNNDENKVSP